MKVLSNMAKTKRRLITIAHSYCVALNRRLAHELAREGGDAWEVTAIAPSFFHADLRPLSLEPYGGPGPEPCRVEPVPVYFSKRVPFMLYGRKLRELLRDSWDVVHGWEEPYVLSGGQIAKWSPRNAAYVFYTFQNLPKRYPPPFSWVERYCLDRCAGWIAAGDTVMDARLERGYGRNGKPRRVLPLGVALDTFTPNPSAGSEVLRKLGWDSAGPPVIGYLGRFVPEKGLDFLMGVLDRLKSEHRVPWRMMFVGGGPMEPALKAWAATHGDAVRVVTGVSHDQVPAHLCAMDILAAPSQSAPHWKEQLGRMLIEAFACGVPVVASDSGEIPYVVADAGIVLGEKDQAGWENILGYLLQNQGRRAELAQRGLDRARSTYAWPVIARSHLEFFEECLEVKSRQVS